MAELVITVAGTPAPQGSKSRDRDGNMFEASKLVRPWRKAVADAVLVARANQHLQGPLFIDATFYVARSKRHYGTGRNAAALRGDAPELPASKPDLDKYERGLWDALKLAGVMGDDCQVTDSAARKRYADGIRRPGALVRVRQITVSR